MDRQTLIIPRLPINIKRKSTLFLILAILFGSLFLPWVAFTVGNGQVTAINPNERIQSITAPVDGFIQSWKVNEGDRVERGQIIANLTDNDPDLMDRFAKERDAAQAGLNSAKLMMETALINLERQKKLYEQGLSARTEYEKAKIDYSKNALEHAKALATLTKAQTQLSRQEAQRVVAPQNGTVIRILPGERGQLIKAGSPIAVFSPDVTLPAVELWVDGADASMILPGQKAQVQFEGWPSIQIAGWPSIAINVFPAKVHLVDQASSHLGKFRVLLVPDGAWPTQRILRLGIHSRGYIRLADSFVLKEIWRQLNGFPPVIDPIKDELNQILGNGDKK
jgi:multidrug efflux pump subunit AcrA (membrane-fusion protein)